MMNKDVDHILDMFAAYAAGLTLLFIVAFIGIGILYLLLRMVL